MEPQNQPAKVYDGPGPGRKKCPQCTVYCGVRSSRCPACACDFKALEAAQRTERLRQEREAAAAQRAAAATAAPAAPETPPEIASAPGLVLVGATAADPGRVVVVAHEGPPPVALPDLGSPEAVRAWGAACIARRPGVYLTVQALLLWLRAGTNPELRRALATVPGVVLDEYTQACMRGAA